MTMLMGGGLYAVQSPRRSEAVRLSASDVLLSSVGSQMRAPRNVSAQLDLVSGDATPAASGPISLSGLARQVQASNAATTTSPPTATGSSTRVTSTSVPPATSPTTATSTKAIAQPTTTTTTTPLTPLTTLLQRVLPTAPSASNHAESGVASWFHAPAATCAHLSAPMGTTIKVTRIADGASTSCRVNDRGPESGTNRVIDLSLDTFQKLANQDAGVIEVRIEW